MNHMLLLGRVHPDRVGQLVSQAGHSTERLDSVIGFAYGKGPIKRPCRVLQAVIHTPVPHDCH